MASGVIKPYRQMTTNHALSVGAIAAHGGADATPLTVNYPSGYYPLFPMAIGTSGGRIIASCYFDNPTATTVRLRAWVVNPYAVAASSDTVNIRVVWQKA